MDNIEDIRIQASKSSKYIQPYKVLYKQVSYRQLACGGEIMYHITPGWAAKVLGLYKSTRQVNRLIEKVLL